MDPDSEDCTKGIHPFSVTVKTWEIFWHALDHTPWLDARDCNDCCFCCLPCTIAIDLVTLVPFSGIYFGKKCMKCMKLKFCKTDGVEITPPPIATQPAKMPTQIVTQPDKNLVHT